MVQVQMTWERKVGRKSSMKSREKQVLPSTSTSFKSNSSNYYENVMSGILFKTEKYRHTLSRNNALRSCPGMVLASLSKLLSEPPLEVYSLAGTPRAVGSKSVTQPHTGQYAVTTNKEITAPPTALPGSQAHGMHNCQNRLQKKIQGEKLSQPANRN